MKNHEKARELYEEVDPTKDFLDIVTHEIHEAVNNYTLKELMESLGVKFVHNEPKEAISLLEAIYEGLEKEKDFIEQNKLNLKDPDKGITEDNMLSRDDLFDEAFDNMHKVAEYYNNEDLLKTLEDYYPLEQPHEVDPMGNI